MLKYKDKKEDFFFQTRQQVQKNWISSDAIMNQKWGKKKKKKL
jgi:hypothetical protein